MATLAPCTCLITGGAGFIGSHLAETLLAGGHKVLVIDDLSTGRWDNLAPLAQHPRFHFVRASIEDAGALAPLASESRVIFHLAAAVGVKLIVARPFHTLESNLRGMACLLEVALRHGCRTVIASSSEVYGKGVKVPFAEDDDILLGPTSKLRWSYAAGKMVDEFLALAQVTELGADIVCARLFNTIGPRQSGAYGMVVPRLIQQALTGQPLTVYGDGRQSRCFCDVRDVVSALIGLAAAPQSRGRVVNVGSTEEVSILDLAGRILRLTLSTSSTQLVHFDEAYAPGFEDLERRVPDTTRIEQLLGWRPTRKLDESLLSVIDYERARMGKS
jgi:UDP-glucose 4-epimerase